MIVWNAPPYRNSLNFSNSRYKYDRAWQPPLSGPDAGSFRVVPKEHKQLIRKTWETAKRDETDRLGRDVRAQECIWFQRNQELAQVTYAHKIDYLSAILEDVNRFVIGLQHGFHWDSCTIFATGQIMLQCLFR